MSSIYRTIQQLDQLQESLDQSQRQVGQTPAEFQPRSIRALGAAQDPTHPMSGQLVGESLEGYSYEPYEDDDDPDVRKIVHMVRLPSGEQVRVAFTPYARMTPRDLELWIRLGMPEGDGRSSSLDSETLEQMAADQNLLEDQDIPIMDKIKMAYMSTIIDAPLGTSSKQFINWWQNYLVDTTGRYIARDQLHKLMRDFDNRTDKIHDELQKRYGDYEGLLKYVDEAKKKPSLRNPADNPCWKGYHPVGTKQKDGRTVPNCVPKESVEEGEVISLNDNPSTLKRLAKQWWTGNPQQYAKAQQMLSRMGWEIYEDDDDIVLSKDGKEYTLPMDQLEGVAEGTPPTRFAIVHKVAKKVLSTHDDLESAKDEWRGLDADQRAYYRVVKTTRAPKDFSLDEAGTQAELSEMDMSSPEFQEKLARLKKRAAEGPLKTVYDPETRKYRNVPVTPRDQDQPVKESVESTYEDILSKLKTRLGDYLGDVAKAVKDTDLRDKSTSDIDRVDAVKTVMTDDGHEIRIHGNEDDGFRITIKNRDSKAKFADLKEAEMAVEMYCRRRQRQPSVPRDYESEK